MMAPGLPPEVVGAPATSPLRASRAQRRSPTARLPRRLALSLPPEQGVPVPPRRPAAMRRAASVAIAASPRPAETSSEAAPQARTSGYTVQIAALSSEATARIYWSSVRQDLPGTFGDLAPEIIRADLPHGTFWRLRTGSFATMTDARGFCQAVRSQGRGCWVPGG
jgi:cell division septation protein DedD